MCIRLEEHWRLFECFFKFILFVSIFAGDDHHDYEIEKFNAFRSHPHRLWMNYFQFS